VYYTEEFSCNTFPADGRETETRRQRSPVTKGRYITKTLLWCKLLKHKRSLRQTWRIWTLLSILAMCLSYDKHHNIYPLFCRNMITIEIKETHFRHHARLSYLWNFGNKKNGNHVNRRVTHSRDFALEVQCLKRNTLMRMWHSC